MATDRYIDLLKQGFMKPRREPRKPAAPKPIVACNDCRDWHRKGKHTADAPTRKANRIADRIGAQA